MGNGKKTVSAEVPIPPDGLLDQLTETVEQTLNGAHTVLHRALDFAERGNFKLACSLLAGAMLLFQHAEQRYGNGMLKELNKLPL
jgi:hypothetical protein